jgi:divalent metal cation (Fe/Co/Zn/Cd) transporter
MEERTKLGGRAAKVGVFGNIILSLFKLIVGIVSNSTAVIADSIHSFSDVATSLMVLFGIRMSENRSALVHIEPFETVHY